MNFTSLSEVLAASTADAAATYQAAPDAKSALSDYIDALSRAAADLHARLHNADEPPRWAEVDAETGQALRNDAVGEEGLSILKHKAGQSRRDADEHARHVFSCIANGLDPDTVPQAYSIADLRKFPFMRETKIGFDRDELAAFLEHVDAATEAHAQNPKGIQLQRKERILAIVAKLDYQAKNLPANRPGKCGPKAEVRTSYRTEFADYTDSKFNKAWEQLVADMDIIIAK